MQLDQFKAVAKPRSEWQTIDLGLMMGRRWYGKLVLVYMVPVILFYLIATALAWQYTWLPILLVWWLKPLWEQPVLYIISRELFGEQVRKREVWRQFFRIVKRDWFWWLTLRRLSPYRGMDLPVTVLEGLKGAPRRKRLDILHRRFTSGATWLLIVGIHIESAMTFGFMLMLSWFVPQGIEYSLEEFMLETPTYLTHLYNTCYLVAMILVAPLFVGGGFALYLQRRIVLEGWDIEIRFRQLLSRKQKQNEKWRNFVGLVMLTGCMTIVFPAQEAMADEPEPPPVTDLVESPLHWPERQKDAKQDAQELVTGDAFRRLELKRSLVSKEKEEELDEEALDNWLNENFDFLDGFVDFVKASATLIEVLLWVTVFGIIGLLVYRGRHFLANIFNEPKNVEIEPEAPTVLFGLQVTEESLPEDVVTEANRLWQSGHQRNALGLLMRGAIVRLMEDLNCPFREGFTEQECAQSVQQHAAERYAQYFWQLTEHWQQVAYAHLSCDDQTYQRLSQDWRQVFSHE